MTSTRRNTQGFTAGLLLCGLAFLSGCDSIAEANPEYQRLRSQFWATTPLEGQLQSPTDIKETADLPPDAPVAEGPTLVVGRIDAGDFDAFDKAEATFIMTQLPDQGHGQDDPDHADNCPFCKRKLQNAPKVVVRFLDDAGKVIPVAADKLFDLSAKDVVVVKGDARFDSELGTVMMDALKLYRR